MQVRGVNGDEWTAVNYKRGEGCSVRFFPLLVLVTFLVVSWLLLGLLVGVAVHVWRWAL